MPCFALKDTSYKINYFLNLSFSGIRLIFFFILATILYHGIDNVSCTIHLKFPSSSWLESTFLKNLNSFGCCLDYNVITCENLPKCQKFILNEWKIEIAKFTEERKDTNTRNPKLSLQDL